MSQQMFSYTKSILKKVSFDPLLFCRELEKALGFLLPYEVELLGTWLLKYTKEKPELQHSLVLLSRRT